VRRVCVCVRCCCFARPANEAKRSRTMARAQGPGGRREKLGCEAGGPGAIGDAGWFCYLHGWSGVTMQIDESVERWCAASGGGGGGGCCCCCCCCLGRSGMQGVC
jgi:hypothetical protein